MRQGALPDGDWLNGSVLVALDKHDRGSGGTLQHAKHDAAAVRCTVHNYKQLEPGENSPPMVRLLSSKNPNNASAMLVCGEWVL